MLEKPHAAERGRPVPSLPLHRERDVAIENAEIIPPDFPPRTVCGDSGRLALGRSASVARVGAKSLPARPVKDGNNRNNDPPWRESSRTITDCPARPPAGPG
jgi:hypothetical protein